MPHARRPHPFRSFDRHLHSTCKTGWHPIRGRRVRSCKASTADLESFAETCTELACVGSHHRRFMRSSDASSTRYPFCNRVETVDSSSFPPRSGERKISAAVFAKTETQTRTERAVERTHRRHRRDEAPQSELGLPTNCTADHFGVRHWDQ